MANYRIEAGVQVNGDLIVSAKTTTDSLQIISGAVNGYVLTSDASGNATWQVATGGGGSGTTIVQFTGNTSATCITDLYVSNVYGCSPVTIHDDTIVLGSISASTNVINGLDLKGNKTGVNKNIAIGEGALDSVTNGATNYAIGYRALQNNLTSNSNIAFGFYSLNALTSGGQNIAIGLDSISSLVGGYHNTAIGYRSLFRSSLTTTSNNTAVGHQTLEWFNGDANTAIGYEAGRSLTPGDSGSGNTFVGASANVTVVGLQNATAIGANAKVSASNSMVLGNNVNVGIGTSTPSEKLEVSGKTKTTELQITTSPVAGYVLTSDASGNATWQAPTGGGSGGTTTSITGFTYSNNNFRIAQNNGTNYVANISTMTGLTVNGALSATTVNKLNLGIGTRNGVPPGPYFENIAIGQESLQKNTTGNNNIAIGNGTLIENTTGSDNVTIVPIGLQYASNNFNNTAVGAGNPGPLSSLGVDVNSFSGLPIAYTNPGNNNTAIGAATLITNFSGSNNTAIGMESLSYYVGHNNTAVGYQSGVGLQSTNWVATSGDAGSENTFLGYKADNTVGGLTNATAIGANAKVSASNSLVLGNNANVGIGISAPTAKLEVSGKTKTTELQVTTNPVTGYVLTSDASGNATWQSAGFQYEIGEYVPSEGGIIFHRWKSNTSLGVPTNGSFENYMVVTTGDTSTSAEYGFENINTSADSSWDGSGNTQTLVSFSGSGTYAAYLCTQVNNGGKTDWYLPSINELVRLMSNRLELEQTLSFIGGDTLTPITSAAYWSSTEYNFFPFNSAFYYLTDQNNINTDPKSTTVRVRAIRKFSI